MPSFFRDEPWSPSFWNNGGSYTDQWGNTIPSDTVTASSRRMKDYYTVDAPYPVHYFFVTGNYRYRPWSFSTDGPYGWNQAVYNNFTQSNTRRCSLGALEDRLLGYDPAYYSSLAVTNASPNDPIVDLSVFLYELREVPRLLRDLIKILSGRLNASDVPNGHLAYELGLRPLLSDLSKLFDVAKAIDKRYYELRKMLDKKRIRRRRKLDEITMFPTEYEDNLSSPGSNTVFKSTLTVWAQYYLQVHGDIPFRPFGRDKPSPLAALIENPDAAKAVYGVKPTASSVWNAIPWTFVIDYFSNIGDVIESSRPGLDWSVHSLWLTSLRQASATATINSSSVVRPVHQGKGVLTYKVRTYHVNPQAHIHLEPFLSKRQVGILGSLFLSRNKGRFQG